MKIEPINIEKDFGHGVTGATQAQVLTAIIIKLNEVIEEINRINKAHPDPTIRTGSTNEMIKLANMSCTYYPEMSKMPCAPSLQQRIEECVKKMTELGMPEFENFIPFMWDHPNFCCEWFPDRIGDGYDVALYSRHTPVYTFDSGTKQSGKTTQLLHRKNADAWAAMADARSKQQTEEDQKNYWRDRLRELGVEPEW